MSTVPREGAGKDRVARGAGSLLGDFARAIYALGPDDVATRQAIGRLLGLEPGGRSASSLAADDAGANTPHTDDTVWQQAAERLEAKGAQLLEEARQRRPGLLRRGRRTAEPVPSTLTPMTAVAAAVERPAWLDDAPPLTETRVDVRPLLEPLLVPRWTPGILTAVVSRDAVDGPIDVLRLIDQVARAELVRRLPLRPRPTLASGAQVLVDVGEPLLPFREDCAAVVERIRRIVGEDRVDVLRFVGSPARGAGTGSARTWRPYETPARPRVVLAITALGTGAGADDVDTDEWITLAERLRAASCPLVALVPTEARRVAPAVRRVVSVLEWDRRTTLAAAVRAFGRSST